MARGNQREVDQAKKQARLLKQGGKSKEGRPEQRNLNDSAALAVKVAKKAEMKKAQDEEDAAKAAASGPVVRKKTKKKEPAGLDDLLSAGLSSGKGKKK
mmetsp:Transcript_25713/g.55324  ORF Transcript_25713/g.55324 Transcript_25713/m.55324 type:complete len:99 (-) Transcript_25713:235-531(-)|eukprot:CAMPEP_0172328490 /NCGR_PEP_ID=MMETSP1058-20130122/60380_1 /TAXON_ID=83371 /ORGANISM="Detonula confervacea, Strain CCMP 353" /LENGTH=98 /DNA_ID=CAMNT_0013045607 /DNA_START=565 /DNA_END=861 /DNA_ORIENTATION=-